MKHIKLFEHFLNESNELYDDVLKKLYNGIKNDYSIQRNTMTWEDVLKLIKKRLKTIPKSDDQFEDELVTHAIKVLSSHGEDAKLKETIEGFARELGFAMDTMRDKDTRPERR